MRVSLNEVEIAFRRAAVGLGWPYGLAEDFGSAAAWMAAHGLDPVEAGLEALRRSPKAISAERSAEGWHLAGTPVLAAGPAAFDLLAADETARHVRLDEVDVPFLLLGFAGIAAAARGVEFAIDFGPVGVARVAGDCTCLAAGPPAPGVGATITMERPAVAAAPGAPPVAGFEVNDALWQRLSAHAARILVPASRDSRLRGAGAGLTDND